MRPLASIIIPCYNGEEYVGEAIESALSQTYPRTEVIVIDDGSTDGSLDVIRSFGDRIRWETGPNRGGSAARNRGLKLAEGELVQFLDADDILSPDKLHMQVAEYERTCADFITSLGMEVDIQTGNRLRRLGRLTDEFERSVCFDRLMAGGPLHTLSSLQKVEGFRPELPCCQERDLHLRLALKGVSHSHVDRVLYVSRDRTGSVSDDHVRVVRQFERVYFRAFERLEARGDLTPKWRRNLAEIMAYGARWALRLQCPELGRRYFCMARHIQGYGALQAYAPLTRILHLAFGARVTNELVQAKRTVASKLRSLAGT